MEPKTQNLYIFTSQPGKIYATQTCRRGKISMLHITAWTVHLKQQQNYRKNKTRVSNRIIAKTNRVSNNSHTVTYTYFWNKTFFLVTISFSIWRYSTASSLIDCRSSFSFSTAFTRFNCTQRVHTLHCDSRSTFQCLTWHTSDTRHTKADKKRIFPALVNAHVNLISQLLIQEKIIK